MQTTSPFLPELQKGRFLVVMAPHAAQQGMLAAAAQMALSGPVAMLDGGNRFDAYFVARRLRRSTPRMEAALGRIRVARAFTCYQMESLLLESAFSATADPLPSSGSGQAENPYPPTLVLDFLATFCDENVPLPERRRLLERCLLCFGAIRRRAGLAVSICPPSPAHPSLAELAEKLLSSADTVWQLEAPLPVEPLRLF